MLAGNADADCVWEFCHCAVCVHYVSVLVESK